MEATYQPFFTLGTGIAIGGGTKTLFFESKTAANRITRERKTKMKPTVEQNNLSRRGDGAQKNGATFPFVDSNYHAVALPNYRGGCLHAKSLSFRSISG